MARGKHGGGTLVPTDNPVFGQGWCGCSLPFAAVVIEPPRFAAVVIVPHCPIVQRVQRDGRLHCQLPISNGTRVTYFTLPHTTWPAPSGTQNRALSQTVTHTGTGTPSTTEKQETTAGLRRARTPANTLRHRVRWTRPYTMTLPWIGADTRACFTPRESVTVTATAVATSIRRLPDQVNTTNLTADPQYCTSTWIAAMRHYNHHTTTRLVHPSATRTQPSSDATSRRPRLNRPLPLLPAVLALVTGAM